jgi:hypothetical protein
MGDNKGGFSKRGADTVDVLPRLTPQSPVFFAALGNIRRRGERSRLVPRKDVV